MELEIIFDIEKIKEIKPRCNSEYESFRKIEGCSKKKNPIISSCSSLSSCLQTVHDTNLQSLFGLKKKKKYGRMEINKFIKIKLTLLKEFVTLLIITLHQSQPNQHN